MIIKKRRTQRKKATSLPLEANEGVISPTMATVNSLVRRETEVRVVDQRQGTAERRAHTANLREVTADLRENKANDREDSADQREFTADLREDTADQRDETADRRQEEAERQQDIAQLREDNADLRQLAADLREKTMRTRRRTEKAKATLSALSGAQMREANEHLVVATVHAQSMTDIAEQATRQMAYMAEHDFLTGLPNRALLTDRLSQSIIFAQRHDDKKVALMYLDLDHFKHVNDSLGHEVGDKLLQSVAQRLQASVRRTDTVSRHGGDEFVILLAEVKDLQDAAITAEKLMAAMAKPHLIAGNQLHVTLSIGISLYPDDGKDVETVVRNADTAMYHAKKSGRNKYQFFTAVMNADAVARLGVEQALHQALAQDDFVLHYQPKVNLKTGVIIGAEALLRWQRSGRRLVSPGKFVSIAEECGLIMPIGKWVLHEACRQTQAWLQGGLNPGLISINVSSVELHGKDFLAGVHAVLNDTGLDAHHLEFELTESGLMQDTEQTMEILRTLKGLGAQIAIDDFGTGYSSLSYLLRFPIDELKIDKSFVQAIKGGDGDAETIVSAVIAMGASLKQRVVAEGIETRKQLAFLQSHDCAAGQGYYFSRPVAAEEFATLLKTDRH